MHAGPTARTIRVASYNLRGFRDDTDAAAEVVRSIDPDVLLVQEAPRHPLASYRVTSFARKAGMLWSGRTHRLAGTTVLTGLRVLATDVQDRPLRVPWPGNPRAYSLTHVTEPGGGRLTAVSVHLPLDAEQRVAHVQRLVAALETDPRTDPDRVVIGGDLNETSGSAAWSLLETRARLVTPQAPTFPATGPRTCIDAIFAGNGLTATAHHPVELDRARLAAASDHLPVWADLAVQEA